MDAVNGQYILFASSNAGILSDCPLTVDEPHAVIISECNQSSEQQWIFTDDGILTLANNTSSSHLLLTELLRFFMLIMLDV